MTKTTERTILLADCQSFYASVEKASYPEYKNKPLAVAGDPARRSGIILAACPMAKSFGVSTAERLGEALKKCPELVIVRPRMKHYIDVSLAITDIYKEYTDLVEVFSIDEQFLDISGSFKIFGDSLTVAREIQKKVLLQTGVWVRIGISSNKVLAKSATDIWAKKIKSGIFTLPKTELEQLLWPQPVNKMFGVGSRMSSHFERLGMTTIGDIARTSLPDLKSKFRARFGKQSDIQAEVMWKTANGLDESPVAPYTFSSPQKSVSHMMTLPQDYLEPNEVETILLELSEEVCRDSRRKGCMGSVVTVSCICSPYEAPTGFSRQMKLTDPTNNTNKVYNAAKKIFYNFWNGMPIRRLGVTLSGLVDDQTYQLSFFEDHERIRSLEEATDKIKERYGSAAIVRASSLTQAGQALERSLKIGGHYK
ncbi:DNA polymerase IV [Paenibacillus polymyxa]|uniref:DNA polymerase IV n=1 Tax=Paenibacillus TaxID=44249 RepID=UPI0002EF4297|nr:MULTISPECIES: DNA polymerase IV [Paenibacillus]KAF6658989.1 DNA polymerase IV [Paenibacillus sp. EKM301P]MBE3649493.1 DNA polymerase IV [Paenibacillus polymyxa]MEE4577103.1 DNA polymerase IV [Paenibacillus polymyxa]NMP10878.1 DNA polymerase IV [Paenibacillus polymyxa]RPE02664.1 DNA polymerase IV [Paenibacillus polymyxa]